MGKQVKTYKIEKLRIEDIKPYPHNPRTHTREQIEKIARNIKEFGFYAPVVVDKDNVLIIGHARLEAMKLLGEEYIPAVRIEDLTEAQVRALRIADNRLTDLSGWDFYYLAQELSAIAEEIDATLTGFDASEIDHYVKVFDYHPDIKKSREEKAKKIKVKCPACGHEFEIEI